MPWVSFGSDAGSMAPEPPFTRSSAHPRAYGNFARLLGRYSRDEKIIPLNEAIRRLSGLPATNLELDRRGFLKEGLFADVVVFDPATIADRATFEKPHQYSVGMKHVFVNGVQVLKDGEHTNAKPGRALWGRGKRSKSGARDSGARALLRPFTRDHLNRWIAILPSDEPFEIAVLEDCLVTRIDEDRAVGRKLRMFVADLLAVLTVGFRSG